MPKCKIEAKTMELYSEIYMRLSPQSLHIFSLFRSGKLGKNNLFARQCSPRGGELKLELTPDCLLVQGEAVVVLEGFVTV